MSVLYNTIHLAPPSPLGMARKDRDRCLSAFGLVLLSLISMMRDYSFIMCPRN